MKPTFFYLGTCSTCNRILEQLPKVQLNLQEIKTHAITEDQLDAMAKLTGSYEALFSRRAMKYRSMGLDKMTLGEADYKRYILEEYTFLKRPVLLADKDIFVGNSKKTVEEMQAFLKA
jgi:arsenate reductase